MLLPILRGTPSNNPLPVGCNTSPADFVRLLDGGGWDVSGSLTTVQDMTRSIVGPFSPTVDGVAAATSLLNGGAAVALFDLSGGPWSAVASAADALRQLPSNRVAVLLPWGALEAGFVGVDDANILATLGEITHSFVFTPSASSVVFAFSARAKELAGRLRRAAGTSVAIILLLDGISMAPAPWPSVVATLHKADIHVAATPSSNPKDSFDVADCLVVCLKSDRPDGLFPTVVVDECGKALGLVYSDGESLREAIRSRRGVYHSRSRCVGSGRAIVQNV